MERGAINKGFPVEMTPMLTPEGQMSYPGKRVEGISALNKRTCIFSGLKVTEYGTWKNLRNLQVSRAQGTSLGQQDMQS